MQHAVHHSGPEADWRRAALLPSMTSQLLRKNTDGIFVSPYGIEDTNCVGPRCKNNATRQPICRRAGHHLQEHYRTCAKSGRLHRSRGRDPSFNGSPT